MEEPNWITARHGINLLLNDKNKEAESLFHDSPQNIHMTAGRCYVTFMNALMCFDDAKVSEAILEIKKIEEQCVTQIGWMKSFKNKIFLSRENGKSLEQLLEEKIVLADALVCQSFLTFLHNDFTSYMKGGWTLRKAWKVYQHTYDQLATLHKKIFGHNNNSAWMTSEGMQSSVNNSASNISSPTWSISDTDPHICSTSNNTPIKNKEKDNVSGVRHLNSISLQKFYSCSSKTFSEFSSMHQKQSEKELIPNEQREFSDSEDPLTEMECDYSIKSSSASTSATRGSRPHSLLTHGGPEVNSKPSRHLNGLPHRTSLRKSISLFSSLNNFSSAILESATSLIGLNREPIEDCEAIDPEAIKRLMSAVCFGYGVFRLCVSLAPPSLLRWANMLGFQGDHSVAIESLNYSRSGTDMRAPLASLALLWYHTIVRPFFSLDGVIVTSGVEEARKILEDEPEFESSALFLFFRGRVERLKPNMPAAIEAYKLSVSNATLPDVKLLGLHEVGWCHLLTLDYQQAYECFYQLRHQSKWSRSFYAYLNTITAGATGDYTAVLPGRAEIKHLLDKSVNKGAQIEKYIRRRMEKLPSKEESEEEWVKDKVHWQLYCFEMLYLWNTFSSCKSSDLLNIVSTCTPQNGCTTLPHEPMVGLSWLVKGAAALVLGTRPGGVGPGGREQDNHLTEAAQAFRACLSVRENTTEDLHISAFAQYELALLLLRKDNTRSEGKLLLMRSQSQYKEFDFEHRLNVRISSTLRSVEKYESQRKLK